MTGLRQVSGRSDLDWEQTVLLGLRRVENTTLASDVLTLMRTVKVVVRGGVGVLTTESPLPRTGSRQSSRTRKRLWLSNTSFRHDGP